MIQNIEERQTRARLLMEQAAFVRGIARCFEDQAEHLATIPLGSDPARHALGITTVELHDRARQSREHAERLEHRAELLRKVLADAAT